MTRLSLCAIARDEQDLIGAMLTSVRDVADELVIGVDDRTTDASAAIAESFGARVLPFTWSDSFAAARNLTLEAAHGAWVLVLDADERLTQIGANVVGAVVAGELDLRGSCGVSFWAAQSSLDGVALGDQQRTTGRLFRRGDCRYWRRCHEEPYSVADPARTSWTLADGAPGLVHLGADPVLWHGRQKHARNVALLEQQLRDYPFDTLSRFKLDQLAELLARETVA